MTKRAEPTAAYRYSRKLALLTSNHETFPTSTFTKTQLHPLLLDKALFGLARRDVIFCTFVFTLRPVFSVNLWRSDLPQIPRFVRVYLQYQISPPRTNSLEGSWLLCPGFLTADQDPTAFCDRYTLNLRPRSSSPGILPHLHPSTPPPRPLNHNSHHVFCRHENSTGAYAAGP